MIEQAPVAMALLTGPDLIVDLMNGQLLRLLQRKEAAVAGTTFAKIFPETWVQTFGEPLLKVLQRGHSYMQKEWPWSRQRPEGESTVWLDVACQPLRDETGAVLSVMMITTDVTSTVLARRQAEGRHLELVSLINTIPQVAWVSNAQGEVSYYNERVAAFSGATRLPNGHWRWEGLLHPDDLQTTQAAWREAVAGKGIYQHEHRILMKDGSYRWHLSRAYPQTNKEGEVLNWCGTATDIHEQKLANQQLSTAEEALQKTALHLQLSTASAGVGTWWYHLASGQLEWSRLHKRMWGYDEQREDLLFEDWYKAIHPDDRELCLTEVEAARLHHRLYDVEYRIVRVNDGALRWMKALGQYHYNDEGEAVTLTGISIDITDQKLRSQSLQDSEERLRLFIAHAPAAVAMFDRQLRYLAVSQRWLQDYQLSPAIIGQSHYAIFPEIPQRWRRIHQQALEGQPTLSEEDCFERQDGSVTWLKWEVRPWYDTGGSIGGIMIFSEDITERKKAEQALLESQEMLKLALDSARTGIHVWNIKDNSIYWDDRLREIWGIGKEVPIDYALFLQALHPDDHQRVQAAVDKAIDPAGNGKYDTEYRIIRQSDGSLRWVVATGQVRFESGVPVQLIGTARDVTRSKNAEAALKNSEARFRSLIEEAPVATCLFTGHQLVIEVANDIMIGYWGKGRAVLGLPLAAALPELKEQPFLQMLQEVMLTGKTYKAEAAETQLLVEGHRRSYYFDFTYKPLFDGAGQVYGVMNMAVDVTAQVLARKKLEESESRFRTLAESLPQLVWMMNAQGAVEYASKKWFDYSGVGGADAAWEAMVHPHDREEAAKAWAEHFAAGMPFRYEVRLKNSEGQYRWHYSFAEPLKNERGEVVKWIGSLSDIHDQKTFAAQLEKEVAERTLALQRSNEDLQQFAHVASHDLKEPVRKIKTFQSRILEEYGAALPPQVKTYLDKMGSAASRMYSMIEGVLLYSSLNAAEQGSEPVDLNEVLAQIETDLEVLIVQKAATISRQPLPLVEGSAVLLYQLFYNLLNNSLKFAREATALHIGIHCRLLPGHFVEITEEDNGIGFSQDNADRIFQTFARLNSKDKYEGTGLGLSLCKKIVERHGGSIRAEGREGAGARFVLTLPLSVGAAGDATRGEMG